MAFRSRGTILAGGRDRLRRLRDEKRAKSKTQKPEVEARVEERERKI
jgi:hypothetical protein